MKTNISLGLAILALGGCAAPSGEHAGVAASSRAVGSASKTEVASVANDATASEPAPVSEDVELTLAAVDVFRHPVELSSVCRMFWRSPGSFEDGHVDDYTHPVCGSMRGGVLTLPVPEGREVAMSFGGGDYPQYLTQVTTGTVAMDFASAPLRLLPRASIDAAYAAAGVVPANGASSVVIETNVQGGSFELLLDTTDEGPAPIYLDAKGAAVSGAKTSIAGGWAVLPNVPPGLHTVTFGHPTEQLEQEAGMGWAADERGSTDVWVPLAGFNALVGGIHAMDVPSGEADAT